MNNIELREKIVEILIDEVGVKARKKSLNEIADLILALMPQYLSRSEIEKIVFEETGVSRNQSIQIAYFLANKIPKPEEDKKPQDIEIFVSADMQGKLTTPIYIGITEITHLGLYEFYGKRWWITETGRLKSLQDNKEPMPIGGICLNCGREVCICKCPKEENKAEPQSYCEYEYPQKLCGRWNVCKKCGLQINPQARKRSER